MSKFVSRFPPALLILFAISPLRAQPAPAGEIQQSLERLNEMGTALMIGAHPDDERTEVLAYLARGRHMRAAYLSITRGEGGQNLLGPEQGAALGLIRTQELLAARRIDGAEQFFTRAIDFGFSKTAAESLQKWGHERVLSDVVWVIRRYRPDVIVLCSTGTPSDGHGHHQASAILGKEAYDAAGDPARFPEQLKFVQPWKPAKIVVSGFGRGGTNAVAPAVQINAGGYDPILGYSYSQLATMSRGQHRSQGLGGMAIGGGMGGGRGGRGADQASPPAPDLFEGIDHSWNRLPGGAAVAAILSQAVRQFDWQHPDRTIPLLAKARPLIAAISDPLAKLKLAELDETIARCAGIWADAQVRQGEATPGSRVAVSLTVTPRLPVEVKIREIRPEGLWAGPAWTPADPAARPEIDLQVPPEQPYSQPYWLVRPPSAGMYTVDGQELIGRPDTPVEQMRIALTVGGAPIEIVRPILFRYNDRLEGEKVRPLIIVPEVSVEAPRSPDLSAAVAVFPSAAPRKVQIAVTANVANAQGELRMDVPAGWSCAPQSQPFQLAAAEDRQELTFEITPPAGEAAGTAHAVAAIGGRRIASGMAAISYPHIPRQTVFPPADIRLVRSEIRVSARRVGYIMGAGDEVPDALRQMGLEVTLLGEEDLRKGDLSLFDAIVAGVRAYNVRPDLRAYHSRLMDYVKGGGTYVVQYMSAGAQNIGPYPIAIPGGNGFRVTVEEAPVTFTHPDSPLLQRPNRIGPRDFEGWVQERALLFPTQWDPRYQTLLASGDPGEKPLEGGVLSTRYGDGVYVFTSYVFFRELPAGVPGAYRLFANLLSAK
ncbi:MAG: PIG-L family deacetylase [Acidobacteriia bacterium]|nr:PIG-L family deacetylase [Terriglobia bacterium]